MIVLDNISVMSYKLQASSYKPIGMRDLPVAYSLRLAASSFIEELNQSHKI
jgi:hypothetical protein